MLVDSKIDSTTQLHHRNFMPPKFQFRENCGGAVQPTLLVICIYKEVNSSKALGVCRNVSRMYEMHSRE